MAAENVGWKGGMSMQGNNSFEKSASKDDRNRESESGTAKASRGLVDLIYAFGVRINMYNRKSTKVLNGMNVAVRLCGEIHLSEPVLQSVNAQSNGSSILWIKVHRLAA